MMRPLLSATLILILVFGGTTGITFAAQTSLPGEILYPVKHVSELVRERLAVSPQAKVSIAALRAERRLAESRELKAQNQLTPEVERDLENQFNTHVAVITTILSEENNSPNFPLSEAAQAVARISANLDAMHEHTIVDASVDVVANTLAVADASPQAVPMMAMKVATPPEATARMMNAELEVGSDLSVAVSAAPVPETEHTPTFEDIARATIAAHEDVVRMHIETQGLDGIPQLVRDEVAKAHALTAGNDGADTILESINITLDDESTDPIEALKDVATINVLVR
jgi:hypothetical protein